MVAEYEKMAAKKSEQDSVQVGEQVDKPEVPGVKPLGKQDLELLRFCRVPRKKREILEHIGLAPVYLNYKRHIQPLLLQHLLSYTIPGKPRSKNQQYTTTAKGLGLLGLR